MSCPYPNPVLPSGLQELFNSSSLLESFHDFSATQFCEENLLFLEDVMSMKKQRSNAMVETIYSRYIKEDSPLQVNIDAELQNAVKTKFEGRKNLPAMHELALFDDAWTHVAHLVERDTLRKFRDTEAGQALRSPAPLPPATLDEVTPTWFRGHLLRRKGFFGLWKPFTYMKKGSYLFEYKPGANHVKSDPLVSINLSGSLIEAAKTLTGRNFTFIVHAKDGKSYFLQASSKEDMHEWMEELSLQRIHHKKTHSSSAAASLDTRSVHSNSSGENSVSSSQKSDPVMTTDEVLKTLPIFGFLESFIDAVVASDPLGMIIAFNSAAEKMFGYTKEEICGQPLKVLMPEPYRSQHDGYLFRHEKFGDEKLIGKTRALPAQRKDGQIFKIQISLGKLPVKGFFIATLREQVEEEEDKE